MGIDERELMTLLRPKDSTDNMIRCYSCYAIIETMSVRKAVITII